MLQVTGLRTFLECLCLQCQNSAWHEALVGCMNRRENRRPGTPCPALVSTQCCGGGGPGLWRQSQATEGGHLLVYISSASNRCLRTEQQWRWWVLKIGRRARPSGSRRGWATWGRLERKVKGFSPSEDALGHGLHGVGQRLRPASSSSGLEAGLCHSPTPSSSSSSLPSTVSKGLESGLNEKVFTECLLYRLVHRWSSENANGWY